MIYLNRWKDRSTKSSVKLPTVDENAEMGRIPVAEIRRYDKIFLIT